MIITAIRTVIIYIFIIAAIRIMGKRQLGELQPAELVVTLLISDLAAVPMQESGMGYYFNSGIFNALLEHLPDNICSLLTEQVEKWEKETRFERIHTCLRRKWDIRLYRCSKYAERYSDRTCWSILWECFFGKR